jgi:hypothetical protein
MTRQPADGRRPIGKALMCAVVFVLMVQCVAADEIIERVLAVVAGDVITLGDVAAARDFGLVSIGATADPIRDILARLIDRSLMLAEVDRYAPPEPTPEAMDRAMQSVRSRVASPLAFEATLARVGMDEKYLREIVRQDLRIGAYIEERFTVPPPADEELHAYYQEHAQAFTRNGQVVPFEEAREAIAQELISERRQAMVDTWIAGLRRRAEITNLYLTSK